MKRLADSRDEFDILDDDALEWLDIGDLPDLGDDRPRAGEWVCHSVGHKRQQGSIRP
jgi:hypothetical protein